ncbi:MAG: hypothetical protein HY796_09870 [Elusimicrobia bacterium]|nr:hypothetical protein [Elusimicrobiota bacterium]
MLTKSDIADIISERLERGSCERAPAAAKTPLKRVFISDRELKRMVKEGQKMVKVPANAIISPLSEDWLDYKGVKILREG